MKRKDARCMVESNTVKACTMCVNNETRVKATKSHIYFTLVLFNYFKHISISRKTKYSKKRKGTPIPPPQSPQANSKAFSYIHFSRHNCFEPSIDFPFPYSNLTRTSRTRPFPSPSSLSLMFPKKTETFKKTHLSLSKLLQLFNQNSRS